MHLRKLLILFLQLPGKRKLLRCIYCCQLNYRTPFCLNHLSGKAADASVRKPDCRYLTRPDAAATCLQVSTQENFPELLCVLQIQTGYHIRELLHLTICQKNKSTLPCKGKPGRQIVNALFNGKCRNPGSPPVKP